MNFIAGQCTTDPTGSEHDVFFQDALNGLSQQQKSLPSKYFYDAAGSRIFEEICDLDEYYVTRTEMEILNTYCHEMASYFGGGMTVIEPGAGTGKKASILLSALKKPKQFIPLEISDEAISMSSDNLSKQHPGVLISPLQGDFTNEVDLQRVSKLFNQQESRMVFFPGSTLGNFSYEEAIGILHNLKILAGESGKILLGVDLIKDRKRLIAAYDDKKGVTARFNLNLLTRMNNELGCNFDCQHGFTHKALFNEQYSRIEMHLVATRDQLIRLGSKHILFNKGETIHTENSHKYSVESIHQLVSRLGLVIDDRWQDDNQDFGIFLLGPSK
ncbi:L-histidine N(alpha)-methyltransferase [Alkalimarinus coralli]|uniref:L-histidine N(alpha)-methyltransferase n=1 Tax=Alkalimarinus coralli TaxID=2935863 RepID=UPI00202ACCF2|nr:L-histidine N(alpha)-methyltransferase [Alkalimarinus coralli]